MFLSVGANVLERMSFVSSCGFVVVAFDWKECGLIDCATREVVDFWGSVESCLKGLANRVELGFPLILEDRSASDGSLNRRSVLRMGLGGSVQILHSSECIEKAMEYEASGLGSFVIVSVRGEDAYVYKLNGENRSVFTQEGVLYVGKKSRGKVKNCIKWILKWAKSRKDMPPKLIEFREANRDRDALIVCNSKKIRVTGSSGEYEWVDV